jgi:hypothetical protein
MKLPEKPLAWMYGGIKSPPFSKEGRVRAGYLLRGLQQDAIVVLGIEKKGTQRTLKTVIAACARRLAAWDRE